MYSEYQKRLKEWQEKNFPPEKSTLELMALGMCEEVGECAHAVLKGAQGIRCGSSEEGSKEAIANAVCDTIVFGMQILSKLDMNIDEEFKKVVEEVLARDWKKNPEQGA